MSAASMAGKAGREFQSLGKKGLQSAERGSQMSDTKAGHLGKGKPLGVTMVSARNSSPVLS